MRRLEAAVTLSARYINDRFLPDKAIDVIDEACSKVQSVKDIKYRIRSDGLWEQRLIELEEQKEESYSETDAYEEASAITERAGGGREKIGRQLKKRFQKKTSSSQPDSDRRR